MTGDITHTRVQAAEQLLKSRGIGEKQIIEALVSERLEQIRREEEGYWLGLQLDEGLRSALDLVLEDSDLPDDAVVRQLAKAKLRDHGYIQD